MKVIGRLLYFHSPINALKPIMNKKCKVHIPDEIPFLMKVFENKSEIELGTAMVEQVEDGLIFTADIYDNRSNRVCSLAKNKVPVYPYCTIKISNKIDEIWIHSICIGGHCPYDVAVSYYDNLFPRLRDCTFEVVNIE